ncbi:MAG: hypothetical protein ACR2OH_13575 [Microthrixaceae bacterium]
MDSRNAFDRQLNDEIEYEVGPPQRVDALEITRQAQSRSPRWRLSMSSTLKFAVASVALAAAGTVILVADPGGQSGGGAGQPSAEASPAASPQDEAAAADMPTGSNYFSGTYTPMNPPVTPGTGMTAPDGIEWTVGVSYGGETIETSDPRLSGSLTREVNWAFLDANRELLAETHAWQVENANGSWAGEGTAIIHSAVGTSPTSFVTVELTGAGGYDGLTAVALVDGTQNPPAVEGAIVAGELVPVTMLPAE